MFGQDRTERRRVREARRLAVAVDNGGPQVLGGQELVARLGFDRFNAHSRNVAERLLSEVGLASTPSLTSADASAEGQVAVARSGQAVAPPPSAPGPTASKPPASPTALGLFAARIRNGEAEAMTVRELLSTLDEQAADASSFRSLRERLEAAGVATTPLLDGRGITANTRLKITAITPRERAAPRAAGPPVVPRQQPRRLADFGSLTVYENRFVADGRWYEIGPQTTATVEVSGSVAATRGRNLAAKAVGGLLVPGGVFLFGNARERVHDLQTVFLTVEDPGWQLVIEGRSDVEGPMRTIAAAIRRAAGLQATLAAAPRAAVQTPVTDSNVRDDALNRLERLAKLRDSGALTDEEFDRQKARLLDAM